METATKHTKENQRKIDFYNRMTNICRPLSGGRNSSPQNSGEIMANINLSRPIFDNRGYCLKSCTYADSRQIREEHNIKILLERITDQELKYFSFMKITEVKPAYFGGKKTKKWEFIRLENKNQVF